MSELSITIQADGQPDCVATRTVKTNGSDLTQIIKWSCKNRFELSDAMGVITGTFDGNDICVTENEHFDSEHDPNQMARAIFQRLEQMVLVGLYLTPNETESPRTGHSIYDIDVNIKIVDEDDVQSNTTLRFFDKIECWLPILADGSPFLPEELASVGLVCPAEHGFPEVSDYVDAVEERGDVRIISVLACVNCGEDDDITVDEDKFVCMTCEHEWEVIRLG